MKPLEHHVGRSCLRGNICSSSTGTASDPGTCRGEAPKRAIKIVGEIAGGESTVRTKLCCVGVPWYPRFRLPCPVALVHHILHNKLPVPRLQLAKPTQEDFVHAQQRGLELRGIAANFGVG
jgi:hypothetical protein